MKNISKDNLSVKLTEEQISKIKELIKEKNYLTL